MLILLLTVFSKVASEALQHNAASMVGGEKLAGPNKSQRFLLTQPLSHLHRKDFFFLNFIEIHIKVLYDFHIINSINAHWGLIVL